MRKLPRRLALIRAGEAAPDAFVVFAARPLLEMLREVRITPIVLSSTIEHRVREEAEALGLTHFFGRHIYGSPADPTGFFQADGFPAVAEGRRNHRRAPVVLWRRAGRDRGDEGTRRAGHRGLQRRT